MEATHHRTGDTALLSYNVSEAPELSGPVDLNSAPDRQHHLHPERDLRDARWCGGVVDHFQMSESSWKDFPDILKWIEKCKVTGLPAGPIINSLWWT